MTKYVVFTSLGNAGVDVQHGRSNCAEFHVNNTVPVVHTTLQHVLAMQYQQDVMCRTLCPAAGDAWETSEAFQQETSRQRQDDSVLQASAGLGMTMLSFASLW